MAVRAESGQPEYGLHSQVLPAGERPLLCSFAVAGSDRRGVVLLVGAFDGADLPFSSFERFCGSPVAGQRARRGGGLFGSDGGPRPPVVGACFLLGAVSGRCARVFVASRPRPSRPGGRLRPFAGVPRVVPD